MQNFDHITVLLNEAIDALSIKPDGNYFDGTFGRGGHSELILGKLNSQGTLIATDRDPQAITEANNRFGDRANFTIVHDSFSNIKSIIESKGLAGKLDGVLLDLGVSSPQFDEGERGFSFTHDGPLDMRMDPTKGLSAKEWLAVVKERELAKVLKEFGEERYAKRIAKALVEQRENKPIETTKQLASVIANAHPNWDKFKHPATKSFQAIRIFINDELGELHRLLSEVVDLLSVGGRLVVISFHSLEDRMVKQFIRKQAKGDDFPRGLPITYDQLNQKLKIIGKPIKASEAEIDANIRSRSAIMRVAEKLR